MGFINLPTALPQTCVKYSKILRTLEILYMIIIYCLYKPYIQAKIRKT